MAKYAVAISAGKSIGGMIRLSVGSGVADVQGNETPESAAMEYALNSFKPSEGYSGHTVSVTKIKEEEAPQKHWFKFG